MKTDILVEQLKQANSEYIKDIVVSQIMFLNSDFETPDWFHNE